jgi:hypothetical protein
MQDIDFLPPKYREATAKRRTQYWRVVVVVAFFGLLGMALAGQFALHSGLEQELASVRVHYDQVLAKNQRLSTIEHGAVPIEADAQLCTYLRHPWPRTRIVEQLLGALPPTITLAKLEIDCERIVNLGPTATPGLSPADAAKEDEKRLPAERDLRRLREIDRSHENIVILEGVAQDVLALHAYLGKLASLGMFSAAEVTSIDSVEKSTASRFRARLVVRPGHGEPVAPAQAPTSALGSVPGEGR